MSEVFKLREEFYVTDEKRKEIERTVFIQADDSVKYEELIKTIDSVTKAGASHIFIDPFKEYCHSLGSGCGYKITVKQFAHKHGRKTKLTKN